LFRGMHWLQTLGTVIKVWWWQRTYSPCLPGARSGDYAFLCFLWTWPNNVRIGF
jgi:hypothetical protein